MARQSKPRSQPIPPRRPETPPGATRKALDRPLERGGGPPGSAAGPRHAADDIDSENETFERMDMTRTLASPPIDEEDPLEKGPPYAGLSGGAVGGAPAQLRSAEGTPRQRSEVEQIDTGGGPAPGPIESSAEGETVRLTGFEAIEYAEKQGLCLNKHPDAISGPHMGLNVAEALAIADEDPDLIWLDVRKEDYYSGAPSCYEPEH